MNGAFSDSVREYVIIEDAYPPVTKHSTILKRICKRALHLPEEKPIRTMRGVRAKVCG